MEVQDTSSPSLVTLPAEVVLAILQWLPPASIVHLSATCHRLHEIARSSSVWRGIVMSIINRHKPATSSIETPVVDLGESSSAEHDQADLESIWWTRASFLLPNSHHLGYWMSSTPYTSRIIRVTTEISDDDSAGVILVADQLVPKNMFGRRANPSSPHVSIPSDCHLDPGGASYSVPSRSFNPDRGLSVDLLRLQIESLPIFRITPSSGALLSSTPYSALAPNRFGAKLKLRLQPVQREVKLVNDSDEERRRSEADAMYSLFTGRTPVLPWPTRALVGTPGRVRGALRGREEWLTTLEGDEDPVLDTSDVVGDTSLGHVTGFTLQIRRQTSIESASASMPGSYPSPPLSTASLSSSPPSMSMMGDIQQMADETPRRRLGVGPRGGPAVLWNGREEDPDPRRGVAIVQANAEPGQAGLVFRLPHIPTQRVTRENTMQDLIGEEIIRTDREEFYPIKAPAAPIAFDDLPATSSDGEILASSLEGLWVGSYGPHGLEYGYLSVEMRSSDEESRETPTMHDSRSRLYDRALIFTKITGDSNVPSGQQSWNAFLSPTYVPKSQDPLHALSPTSVPESQDPLHAASMGTVPSVTNETLLRWATQDPTLSSYNGADGPRWDEVTLDGAGRVALSGFVNPGWTSAAITLIRSSTRVTRLKYDARDDGEVGEEVKVVDTVEEIRLRWPELGKVGVFCRVRV